MVLKSGVDMVDIGRFKNAICDTSPLNAAFTKGEIGYCKRFSSPEEHIAVRWAAKRAVLKALGAEGEDLKLSDIEILNRPDNSPFVNIEDSRLQNRFKYFISLSHSDTKAIAFAIIEKTGS